MLPTGLYLLGSRSADATRRNLMTLSWATQLATEPKLLGVGVEVGALTHQLINDGRCFALSILSRADRTVVRRFVKPAVEDADGRLNGFAVQRAPSGAPVLSDAAAWLDCELRHALDCGSHTLFVGEVTGCAAAPDFPASDEAGVLRMEDTRMNYGG